MGPTDYGAHVAHCNLVNCDAFIDYHHVYFYEINCRKGVFRVILLCQIVQRKTTSMCTRQLRGARTELYHVGHRRRRLWI